MLSMIKVALYQRRYALRAVLSLSLFILALWMLHQELAHTRLSDIRHALGQLEGNSLMLAILGTTGSYVALTGYDVLALRHLGKTLPYPRVALTSFIANAVGHNLGMAMLSAGMIRLRLYSAAGLSATEVTGVVAMIGLNFVLGVTFVCGMAMFVDSAEAGMILHLQENSARVLGALLLTLVAVYMGLALVRRKPIRLHHWQVRLPGPDIALGQLILAGADLACVAAALYWLLPTETAPSFPVFLGVYVMAVVVGIASHVPAGLGVFETVLLLALPGVPQDALLAAILVYRAIYYLLPLVLAALLAVDRLVRDHRDKLAQGLFRVRGVFAWMAPITVGVSVFITGAVLLFSGSTPALTERVSLLHEFVPLPLLEVSHLTGSFAGLGLVILARALYRRVDAAYHLAFWLLLAGALASLIKGLDYEEALLSIIVLSILWLGREAFNRPALVMVRSFSQGWMLTVLLVLIATFWLGIFSYKHLDYSQELWWQFALHGDASRFLRTSLLLALIAVGLGLMHLLRPAPPEPARPNSDDMVRVARIVAVAPETGDSLALLGDKRLLFSPADDAFIMYQVRGMSWVAMGDPVGPESACEALAWRFREMADHHGGRAVFYQVRAENLSLYLDLGLSAMKLGEEGVVPLPGFSLEGSSRKDLRQAHRRAERDGLSFEMVPREALPVLMEELKQVSDTWLAEKHTREKGFALGYFQPKYLAHFPCALIRMQGRIVAFANVLTSYGQHELSIDLMRHLPEAPKGVMDYLFVELMLWGAHTGYKQFNLGMAPLSGLETHPLAHLWHRLGTLIYQQSEHFYNFEGLRAYKSKFDPTWSPKYLAAPGGLGLPTILLDVAALISGGIKGVFSR